MNQTTIKVWHLEGSSGLKCYIQVPFRFCDWVHNKIYNKVRLCHSEYIDEIIDSGNECECTLPHHWGSSEESLTGNNLKLWEFPSLELKNTYLQALEEALKDWNKEMKDSVNTSLSLKDPSMKDASIHIMGA